MNTLRIALAQINSTVGDIPGNGEKIRGFIDEARRFRVDLVAFPELAITGYPPEDLLLKTQFISQNLKELDAIRQASNDITVVVGFVDLQGDLFNAAAFIKDRELLGVHHKVYLPNYGVFDEDRYFRPGTAYPVFSLNGAVVGVNVCEDIWHPSGPASIQTQRGAQIVVNISSSPYHAGKRTAREKMLTTRSADYTAVLAYVNMVGGQDELVFDGGSFLANEKGEVIARGKQFEEDLVLCDVDLEAILRARLHDPRFRKEAAEQMVAAGAARLPGPVSRPPIPARKLEPLEPVAEVYQALVLGTRDYVRKNGFQKVAVGLSGGVDSSLVAVIAVDALGPENVVGVAMPSQFTSSMSKSDAEMLARNLGIQFWVIPIEETFTAYLNTLAPSFKGLEPNSTEENIQARIRGNILMALSNKFGWLVLTTGNKSEVATGYCTLYGDMAGGFAVIKDVFKTMVYKLARYRNAEAGKELIPGRILEREPSAELRANQKDSDSLPVYDLLDPILAAYVEEDRSLSDIVKMGFDREVVRKVINLVDGNEYKRRQAAPGVKITQRAFGKDRRLPITNRFVES
ncbi:MAG: NAD+ synthase [Chloroflexota bacterium]